MSLISSAAAPSFFSAMRTLAWRGRAQQTPCVANNTAIADFRKALSISPSSAEAQTD